MDEDLNELSGALINMKRLSRCFTKAEAAPYTIKISPEETFAVIWMLTSRRNSVRRIAELGTFLGGTANLLAELSSPETKIEIYDFFEHNSKSRARLRGMRGYNRDNFFGIWAHNTKANAQKFELYRGDIRDTSTQATDPLDVLFVDIVKHPAIVSVLNTVFYNRLSVGGVLFHQDYFHYQSPWIVYQMEILSEYFSLIGHFGNNMAVYIKTSELPQEYKTLNMVKDVANADKYAYFDRAIDRFGGNRGWLLTASKLRLTLDDPNCDSGEIHRLIDGSDASPRVKKIANYIMENQDELRSSMW